MKDLFAGHIWIGARHESEIPPSHGGGRRDGVDRTGGMFHRRELLASSCSARRVFRYNGLPPVCSCSRPTSSSEILGHRRRAISATCPRVRPVSVIVTAAQGPSIHRFQSGCCPGAGGRVPTATSSRSPAVRRNSQSSASTDSGSAHCRSSATSSTGPAAANASRRSRSPWAATRGVDCPPSNIRPGSTPHWVSSAYGARSFCTPSAVRTRKSRACAIRSARRLVLPSPG